MINDDPRDERPRAIEELDNLPVGPVPIDAVIDAGVSTRRRRRAVLASAAAVLVVLVGATAVSTQLLGVAGDDDALVADGNAPPATPEILATPHTVTVNAAFKPGTPRFFYFEGSLEEVRLERTTSSEPVQVKSATASAPWQRAWSDLPSGEYTIYAAVRPCGGNCSNLNPPADTCEQTFTLDSDVAVAVEFEYGESCRVTTTPQEATTPTRDLSVSVDILAPGGTEAVPPGTARWDPDRSTLAYVGRLDYSGSCLPVGTATSTEGSVALVLTVASEETPCTADANTVFATITGLIEAPSEITVTEDGKPRTISVETSQASESASGLPQCTSGQTVAIYPYFAPPTSPAEAEGLPATPQEAARDVLGGALLGGEGFVLGSPERADTFRFPVLTSTRKLAGSITVEGFGFGAYGVTEVERCAE